jgi:hypothetical protein
MKNSLLRPHKLDQLIITEKRQRTSSRAWFWISLVCIPVQQSLRVAIGHAMEQYIRLGFLTGLEPLLLIAWPISSPLSIVSPAPVPFVFCTHVTNSCLISFGLFIISSVCLCFWRLAFCLSIRRCSTNGYLPHVSTNAFNWSWNSKILLTKIWLQQSRISNC